MQRCSAVIRINVRAPEMLRERLSERRLADTGCSDEIDSGANGHARASLEPITERVYGDCVAGAGGLVTLLRLCHHWAALELIRDIAGAGGLATRCESKPPNKCGADNVCT
jgi:hypothetical protein